MEGQNILAEVNNAVKRKLEENSDSESTSSGGCEDQGFIPYYSRNKNDERKELEKNNSSDVYEESEESNKRIKDVPTNESTKYKEETIYINNIDMKLYPKENLELFKKKIENTISSRKNAKFREYVKITNNVLDKMMNLNSAFWWGFQDFE